jgi:hypothetical protein
LSIHPGAAGTSHEQEKPLFPCKKLGAEPDYSEGRKRTQGQMSKKGRKTAIFLWACAKRADFMRQNEFQDLFWRDWRVLCCLIPN